MWWVGGSHLVNFWAIWSVVWKKVYVAPDIMYVLPDAHTHIYSTVLLDGTWSILTPDLFANCCIRIGMFLVGTLLTIQSYLNILTSTEYVFPSLCKSDSPDCNESIFSFSISFLFSKSLIVWFFTDNSSSTCMSSLVSVSASSLFLLTAACNFFTARLCFFLSFLVSFAFSCLPLILYLIVLT